MTERDIFIAALDRLDQGDRERFLDEACGNDLQLRRRIDALLNSHRSAENFLERPIVGLAATIVTSTAESTEENHQEPPPHLLTPSEKPGCLGTLGKYEVVELVGRGGMGLVVRAYDPKLNRIVAIKVMAPELAVHPMAARRFMREAQAAAPVSHDHVVTIHAIEETHRPPFIVMEFIGGQSLQQKIDRVGALELKEILRIGMQTAAGLAAAHKQGLVHRDIKPANILLENGVERVKLTDFGLARAVDDVGITQTGQISGTPSFMSPEQAQGEPVDHRSDLFSLGSVLYTMCTGRPPFRAETAVATLRRVCDDTPRPLRTIAPEVPEWLEAIIAKLHAKNPADRFQSAAEVAELLGQCLAHLQQPGVIPMPAAALQLARHPVPIAPSVNAATMSPTPTGTFGGGFWLLVGIILALFGVMILRQARAMDGAIFGMVAMIGALVSLVASLIAFRRDRYKIVIAADPRLDNRPATQPNMSDRGLKFAITFGLLFLAAVVAMATLVSIRLEGVSNNAVATMIVIASAVPVVAIPLAIWVRRSVREWNYAERTGDWAPGWIIRCMTCGSSKSLSQLGWVRIGGYGRKTRRAMCSKCGMITRAEIVRISDPAFEEVDPDAKFAAKPTDESERSWLSRVPIAAWIGLIPFVVIYLAAFAELQQQVTPIVARVVAVVALGIAMLYLAIYGVVGALIRVVRGPTKPKREPQSWRIALFFGLLFFFTGVFVLGGWVTKSTATIEHTYYGPMGQIQFVFEDPTVVVKVDWGDGNVSTHYASDLRGVGGKPGLYMWQAYKDDKVIAQEPFHLRANELQVIRIPQDPQTTDFARLQGRWTVVSQHVNGKPSASDSRPLSLVFDQNRVRQVEAQNRFPFIRLTEDSFALESKASPKSIDLGWGGTGIYQLDEDKLTLCFPPSGSQRPTAFVSTENERGTLTVLQRAPQDDKLIQGHWQVVSQEVEGNILVEKNVGAEWIELRGNVFRMKHAGTETVTQQYFELNPAPSTCQIDLFGTQDRAHEGIGIYSLDGDNLKLCVAPSDQPRPRDFSSKSGSRYVVTTLRRVLSDAELIQGRWRMVSQKFADQEIVVEQLPRWVVFEKDRIRNLLAIFGVGENDLANEQFFELNPATKIAQIDVYRQSEHQLEWHGIYRLDQKSLTLSLAPANMPRPTEFTSSPDSQVFVTVLSREPAEKE